MGLPAVVAVVAGAGVGVAEDGVGGGDCDEALRGGGVVGVVVWVVEGGEGVELSRGEEGGVSVGGDGGVWGVTKEEEGACVVGGDNVTFL